MSSFRTRLVVGITAIVVPLVLATGLVIFIEGVHSIDRGLDQALVDIGDSEHASNVDRSDVRVHNPAPILRNVSGMEGYEKVAWIENRKRQFLARTTNLRGAFSILPDGRAEQMAWTGKPALGSLSIDGQAFRAIYYPLFDPATNRHMVGVVGVSAGPRDASIRSLGVTSLVVVGISALVGAVIGLAYARGVVRPLKGLADQARSVQDAPAGTRVAVDQEDRELSELAGAINMAMDSLERTIKERERLIQTQRAFVSDASHELRNPVANILGTAEVALRRSRPEEEYEKALGTILAEGNRMKAVINDLLLLARSDAGHLQLDLAPLDLRQLCDEAAEAVSAIAEVSHVRVSVSGQSVPVMGDEVKLRQAIDNLAQNGVRHARSHVRIHVRANGVCVSNDGPLIEDADISKLFVRFFRSGRSRSRDSGGTGLGLAIVEAVIRAHGGKVEVHNVDRVEFEFTLPNSLLQPQEAENPPSMARQEA